MKCPVCNKDLVLAKHSGVDVEFCQSCKGLWLTRKELEQLEDEVYDWGDDKKGTLVFSSTPTDLQCPQCSKPMKKFEYRLYNLEMDFCEDGDGFWLTADEDKRVLELMKKEEAGFERKTVAENQWAAHMRYLRSGSLLDRIRDLLAPK